MTTAAEQEQIDNLLPLLRNGSVLEIKQCTQELHPADIAESLQPIEEEERQQLVENLPASVLSEVLPYFEETVREQIVLATDPDLIARAVQTLETDDAIELLNDLNDKGQQEVLAAIPAGERAMLQEALNYPDDSAGRLMQREVLSVPEHWTVGQAIDHVRENPRLPENFYSIYLTDIRHQVTGAVGLAALVKENRDTALKDIAYTQLHTTNVLTDAEDVAYTFRKYGLASLPVLDANERLVGVIMVDDILHVIEEEAEEDILRMAGVGEQTDFYRGSLRMVRSRAGWLFINLLTAIMASMVISLFEDSIQQLVALAIILPIVASMGGNAGMQTLTVMIRAIALRQLDPKNAWRVIGQEITAGLLNGLIFATVTGIVTGFWFGRPEIGLVVAAAMVINLLFASLAGAFIPLGLRKIGADPAIASGVFLTTVTDVVGFFAVLGLAALFLL